MLSAPHTKIKKQKMVATKRQIYVTVLVRHFSEKKIAKQWKKSIIMLLKKWKRILRARFLNNLLSISFRAEDEAEFREFLETVAVVLCSDIEITSDTFHRAAKGYGVSSSIIIPQMYIV